MTEGFSSGRGWPTLGQGRSEGGGGGHEGGNLPQAPS